MPVVPKKHPALQSNDEEQDKSIEFSFPRESAPYGAAGGDLEGAFPDPSVKGIRGREVDDAAPTNGQGLIWNSTTAKWEPSGTGLITGLTTGKIPKATSATSLGDSCLTEGTSDITSSKTIIYGSNGDGFTSTTSGTLKVAVKGVASGSGGVAVRADATGNNATPLYVVTSHASGNGSIMEIIASSNPNDVLTLATTGTGRVLVANGASYFNGPIRAELGGGVEVAGKTFECADGDGNLSYAWPRLRVTKRIYHGSHFQAAASSTNGYPVPETPFIITLSNGSVANGLGSITEPGIYTLSTTTNAAGRIAITTNPTGIVFGGGTWEMEWKIRLANLSSGTERYLVIIGFTDSTTGHPTDGIYFSYTDNVNGGLWETRTREGTGSGSTAISAGIAPTANTWHTLKITVNAAGTEAKFYIDGALVATHNSTNGENIPTASTDRTGFGALIAKSVGTTARTLELDYYEVDHILT